MIHYRDVRDRKVDCNAFAPEMRQEAHTWLAPICDCPELSRAVASQFLRRSREIEGARLVNPKCVVAEGALFFCHKAHTKHFFVGQLTETANLLLQGRHEEPTLSAKGVGSMLREFHIYGERVARGYRIHLTDPVRKRIHQVAHDFQVASLKDGVRRCRYCLGNGAASTLVQ